MSAAWYFDSSCNSYATTLLADEEEANMLARLGIRKCLEDANWLSEYPEVRHELMAKVGALK
jgi:hypothetical protein